MSNNVKVITANTDKIAYHIKVIIDLADNCYELGEQGGYGTVEYEKPHNNLIRRKAVKHFLQHVYDADWEELITAFCGDEADELIARCKKNGLIIA